MKKVILFRNKRQEEINVPLWYQDKNMNFIVSVVGSQGNTRMRISTPTKSHEVGLVGADFSKIQDKEETIKKSAERYLKLMGYDAKIK